MYYHGYYRCCWAHNKRRWLIIIITRRIILIFTVRATYHHRITCLCGCQWDADWEVGIGSHRIGSWVDESSIQFVLLTSDAGVVGDSHAAKTIECDGGHFTGASGAVLIVPIILRHWIRIVAIDVVRGIGIL